MASGAAPFRARVSPRCRTRQIAPLPALLKIGQRPARDIEIDVVVLIVTNPRPLLHEGNACSEIRATPRLILPSQEAYGRPSGVGPRRRWVCPNAKRPNLIRARVVTRSLPDVACKRCTETAGRPVADTLSNLSNYEIFTAEKVFRQRHSPRKKVGHWGHSDTAGKAFEKRRT